MWLDIFKDLKLDYVKYDEDLKKYNTYGVGGLVKVLASPRTQEELLVLLNFIRDYKVKYMLLGNGSNVIFSSKEYDGIIIKLDNFNSITYDDNKVVVDAGYSLIRISNELCNKGFTGFEFATGVPGTVGGAIYMNAGCYNSSISEILESVTFIDDELKIKTITNEECEFGYRESIFKYNDYIILNATFKIGKGNADEIKDLVNDRRERRLATQPLDKKSAGSTFRNPVDTPSWKLIDECGLRGKHIGGAAVSEKHSNFLINDENATGEELKELIELIQKEVKNKYNIELILEQELINF